MGAIITISGPSGAGKDYILNAFLERHPEIARVPGITSRVQRRGEEQVSSATQFGVSHEEIEARRARGDFLWVITVHGHYYGTERESIDRALQAPHPSVMIITPGSIPTLLAYAPPGTVIPLFIVPAKEEVLRARLRTRGDDPAEIERRVNDCKEWTEQAFASTIPYYFLRNEGTVLDAVTEMEQYLRVKGAIR